MENHHRNEEEEEQATEAAKKDEKKDIKEQEQLYEQDKQDDGGDFDLDPPITCCERFRDSILRTLDNPFFQVIGIIVIVLVILDGAFFFFLLMGWHTLCDTPSRTDCDPRNWWYNFSIQLLNVLFTYMNLVAMPWRCTQLLHITGWSCPYRQNDVSYDLYGRIVEDDPWYHIPLSRRCGITTLLLFNALTQFANQATRIVFYDFDSQNTSPGNIWTNVFFVASFLCAGVAGAWMAYEVTILRKTAHPPNQFGPSIKQVMNEFCKEHDVAGWCCCRCGGGSGGSETKQHDATGERKNDDNDKDVEPVDDEEVARDAAAVIDVDTDYICPLTRPVEAIRWDPTRDIKRRSIIPVERSTMRMWAM